MATLHARSSCCGAKVQRFGGRRRRCSNCGRTWSIRPKRRGRKPRRIARDLPRQVLLDKQTTRQLSRTHHCSLTTIRRRLRNALSQLVQQPHFPVLPEGELVLIVDGLWFSFKRQYWVLYDMALKPLGANTAYFLDPALLSGREHVERWEQALDTIRPGTRKRVRALVSDGFRGSKGLARKNAWLHQRCHFHVLAQLQGRPGRQKRNIRAKSVREAIYEDIREALVMTDEQRLEYLQEHLRQQADRSDCPRRTRGVAREFLRNMGFFRTYLRHPELELPTTTGAIESMHNLIRDTVRRISSPRSLLQWATAFTRLHPTITCNGKNLQQK